jgi:hypothetical protein
MKKIEDDILDVFIKHASKAYLDEMVDEYPNPKSLIGKYEFSSEFEKWANETIKKEEKRNKKTSQSWNKVKKVSFRVASVAYLLIASSIFVAFTVPPVREKLTNYIVTYTADNNIELNLQNEEEEQDCSTDKLSKFYLDKYHVEGFNIINIENYEIMLILTYQNDRGEEIRFERHVGTPSIITDGEKSEFSSITINNNEGYISYNKSETLTTIFWHDEEYSYIIMSKIDKNKVIELAERFTK